jgi:hypothetical protein
MDSHQFASELWQSLTDIALFNQVAMHSEGPIVEGRAFLEDAAGLFLRFYYNSQTGTLAFALIENEQRIWGIDYDNRRGWHLHPVDDPTAHQAISSMSVGEIIMTLEIVLTNPRQSKIQ